MVCKGKKMLVNHIFSFFHDILYFKLFYLRWIKWFKINFNYCLQMCSVDKATFLLHSKELKLWHWGQFGPTPGFTWI